MKISLCMLTLNEIDGCKHDIPLIKKISKNFNEIFVVDNGSKDGTIEYLKKQGVKVHFKAGISYNDMHHLAFKKSKSDAVIFFHPKGTIPVKDTLKFNKYFDQGYDFVVASRLMKNSKNEEDGQMLKPRKWLIILFAIITSILWKREGNMMWDILHGFRGLTVKAYKKIHINNNDQTIDLEEIVQSYKHHLRRIEFPTKEGSRLGGETHFKIIPFGTKVVKFLLREIFNVK